MKIKLSNQEQGSAIILTLCTVLILGIILSGYLKLVTNQNVSIARSQAWNSAIPVLEGGIEEALTVIHYGGHTNLATNGWTLGADKFYHKTRHYSDGSYFSVSIQPTNPPVIYSTGYVAVPYTSSVTNYVTRTVRVTTKKQPAGRGGLNAKNAITFSGNPMLDSFDSEDPLYNTNGKYDPAKRKDNGSALTNSKQPGAISLGNSKIYGWAVTGPGGTVSYTSGGGVGDIAWNASHSGIQTTPTNHWSNDANVQFKDVPAPFEYGTKLQVSKGTYTVGGTNYIYNLGEGEHQMDSFSISSQDGMVVTGNATLYVNGPFSISGHAFIYIAPGASLNLYINGDASFSGGGIINGAQSAKQLNVYGMPGAKTIQYSGGASFVGTLYAPNAALTFTGSSDVTGSFTADSISLSGNASVHYDEALSNVARGYAVVSWNEL